MFVKAEDLKELVLRTLTSVGVPEIDALIVADHMIEANLRGRDSHGVFVRLPPLIRGIKLGTINPRAKIDISKRSSAVALINGNGGIGQVVSMKAIDVAVKMCRYVGVGFVSVRGSSHIGFLGYYTERMARKGLVGIVLTNTEPAMPPPGCVEPILGTNPISVGIPTKDNPIVIDMSTSKVSRGKIVSYLKNGKEIPLGWAIDSAGRETTDPSEALSGAILPIAGVKGYCLSLGFDVLTGALSGAAVGMDVKGTLHTDQRCTKGDLFVAINPEFFSGREVFLDRVERLKVQIKNCKRIRGVSDVLLPGERSLSLRAKRLKEGIPVEEEDYREFLKFCYSV